MILPLQSSWICQKARCTSFVIHLKKLYLNVFQVLRYIEIGIFKLFKLVFCLLTFKPLSFISLALNVQGAQYKFKLDECCKANGQLFLVEVLSQLWHSKDKEEFIYVDRNLHIERPNNYTIRIGEEVKISCQRALLIIIIMFF